MTDPEKEKEAVREELRELQLRIQAAADAIEKEQAERKRQWDAIYDRPISYLSAYNERIKYTATLINTVAAGCLIAGFIGPVAAFITGAGVQLSAVLTSSIWLPIGFILHLGVRAMLKNLRE